MALEHNGIPLSASDLARAVDVLILFETTNNSVDDAIFQIINLKAQI